MTRIRNLSDRERAEFSRLARVTDKAAQGELDRVLLLAYDFDSAYPSTGGEGRRSPGPSDPTASTVLRHNAARSDADGDQWRSPPAYFARMVAAARQLVKAMERLEAVMGDVTRHSMADPDNVAKEVYCRNPNCFDVIYTGTGDYPLVDWCPPCYRWRTEHGVEAPATVIAERGRGRERRATADASSATPDA